MKATVHKVTLLVIDTEQMPADEVAYYLANHRHVPGRILSHDVTETDWDDDHPLNKRVTLEQLDAWLQAQGSASHD